jgi:formylglycine-generating enzyme required for sulfatase activity
MVLVEAGGFDMGTDGGPPAERPAHHVNISRAFYISRHEVTVEQFDQAWDDLQKPRLDDYGWGRGLLPVTVSWYDATEFCNWLSERAGLEPCYSSGGLATACDFAASGYRLPTEAEWEYAAGGGIRSQGNLYAGGDAADEVAWHAGNSDERAHLVGGKLPNELGLFDMSGNVWEWCWDWYDREYYARSPIQDPLGPDEPSDRTMAPKVRRGGSWYHDLDALSPTYRSFDFAHYRSNAIGFRLSRTAG